MSSEWKIKYYDLKQKFLDATDTAFRLGYEQGAKETQVEMQAQQMEQQQAQQAAMQGGAAGVDEMGNPVDEMGNPVDPNQMQDQMQGQEGQELPPDVDPEVSQQLDDHINELESLVAKGQKPSVTDMRKVVEGLAIVRKSQKEKWSKNIKKQASSQKSFVDNILQKWEKESKDVTSDLEEQIKKEGLKLED